MPKGKATHYGECQICGRVQKYPSGGLAKHGYTVEDRGNWGFFNGTCTGSDAIPFELDRSLAKKSLETTAERRKNTIAYAEKVRDTEIDPADVKAWYRIHDYNAHPLMQKRWEECAIVSKPIRADISVLVVVDKDGKEHRHNVYDFYGDNAIELARRLNSKRADEIFKEAAQMQHYIDWQTERVNNWKQKELTPVK